LIEPYKKRLEALESKWAGVETNQKQWEEQEAFKSLRAQGYTDEGIEAVKDIMKNEGIKNPNHAAAIFDKMNPPQPAAPNGLASSSWNFGGQGTADEDLKQLWTNEDAWADKEAIKTFQEFRTNKAG
jgi:hypothetical protein